MNEPHLRHLDPPHEYRHDDDDHDWRFVWVIILALLPFSWLFWGE